MTVKSYDRAMGARGKARREELGLSPMDLAVKMGVSGNRVYMMEKDGCLGVDLVRRWAQALGIEPGFLAFGEGDAP